MGRDREPGMTVIVKTITRLTLGFILLYGIYISLNGHNAPGGGFAGGVIVALSFVHVMLAFGKKVALKRLHSYVMRGAISLGALAFLYTVMVSFGGGCVPLNLLFGQFKSCPVFNSEVTVPLCEMVVVGAGLFALFTALVLLSKTDKDSE